MYKLIEIPGNFSIIRLGPEMQIPVWVMSSRFYSIVKTDEELSIVCESSLVLGMDIKKEDDWKCLKAQGTLDFLLTGILSSIAAPLAAAQISIFAISTFNTDYVMVKNDCLARAREVLIKAGFDFC